MSCRLEGHVLFSVIVIIRLRPQRSSLFPYTTLFRSGGFAVIGNNTNSGTNGGVSEQYSYGGVIALNNSNTDWLVLKLPEDRKSTRLNSSHVEISYAVFCLKKKKLHS